MTMSNCSFATQNPAYYCKYFTAGRVLDGKECKQRIFTPHQIWGHCNNASLVKILNDAQASCNYSIHDTGEITLMVDEANRSWCSSSRVNDAFGLTTEISTDRAYPYKCTDSALTALLNLCIDWCKRNGIHKIHWIPDLVPYRYPNPADKKVAEGGVDNAKKAANEKALVDKLNSLPKDEALISQHHWFYNKPCAGDYIESKLAWLAEETNKQLETIKVGDIVLMEVTEIKDDGYAYGKVKVSEPLPPVPKGIVVGSKVTINVGAKAGGLNDKYRGKPIDSKYANGKYVDTVNKIEAHYGIEEARLQNIVTWVAVSDLTLVE